FVRRIADVGRVAGNQRQDADRLRRHDIRLIATFNDCAGSLPWRGSALSRVALYAVRDLRLGKLHVLAEQILGNRAQAVLVLEEPPVAAAQIGRVRSAGHLERRELHDRRLQLRLVDDDLHLVGLERGAREDKGERLADADRAGRRPPPALHRVGFGRLRLRLGGGGRRGHYEQQGSAGLEACLGRDHDCVTNSITYFRLGPHPQALTRADRSPRAYLEQNVAVRLYTEHPLNLPKASLSDEFAQGDRGFAFVDADAEHV